MIYKYVYSYSVLIQNFANQVVRQKPVKNCVKEPQEKCKTVYEEVCENYEEKCSSPVYEEKCENIQEEKCEPVTLTECKAEPIQVTKIMKGHRKMMYNYLFDST